MRAGRGRPGERRLLKSKRQHRRGVEGAAAGDRLTCDAAEEAQGGRLARVLVDHALVGRLRHRDRQRDGFVELAAARLHRHDRRNGHPVAQHLGHQLGRNRLGLCHTRKVIAKPAFQRLLSRNHKLK